MKSTYNGSIRIMIIMNVTGMNVKSAHFISALHTRIGEFHKPFKTPPRIRGFT